MTISNWTQEEDYLILELQKQWGNKWSAIAKVRVGVRAHDESLEGRTSNDVKSRFKSLSKVAAVAEH